METIECSHFKRSESVQASVANAARLLRSVDAATRQEHGLAAFFDAAGKPYIGTKDGKRWDGASRADAAVKAARMALARRRVAAAKRGA